MILFCAICAAAPSAAQAQGFFGNFNLFGPPPQYRPQEFEPARPRLVPHHPHHPHPHPLATLPKPGAPGAKSATPAQPDEPPPPYEPQLLRLSELLGALTYLQNLCGGENGHIWRDKMTALMDAETQNPLRRSRLAGAYNRGFNGYELNYRQCTPNAQAIIDRFLDESGRIARDVAHRYGTS
ncbi:MAG: TIGR02301 family protein [Methylovirgula sp.]|nr:TIGR02301 family protein [Methylovirgula sp.]